MRYGVLRIPLFRRFCFPCTAATHRGVRLNPEQWEARGEEMRDCGRRAPAEAEGARLQKKKKKKKIDDSFASLKFFNDITAQIYVDMAVLVVVRGNHHPMWMECYPR